LGLVEEMKKSKGMVKVTCECGEEILLLPDLKEMGKAIEDHVDMHLQNLKAPACNAKEADRLRDALIAQVLSIASQPEDEDHQ
jgi:hypothetical protein